ncbi:MAG: twin-arginine translocase TatA/TatE family subunit [Fervidicoccaceae archaeon]
MPLSLGTPEILIILAIALLILGPSKLPQLARSLGEALREYRRAVSGEEDRPRAERMPEVDDELLLKLAERLGVSREGKTPEELKREILEKARERGLLEEARGSS